MTLILDGWKILKDLDDLNLIMGLNMYSFSLSSFS